MTILNAGEDAEQLDHSYIAGGNIKWYRPSEHVWQFLINYMKLIKFLIKLVKLSYPRIAFLGIYPTEVTTYIHSRQFWEDGRKRNTRNLPPSKQ